MTFHQSYSIKWERSDDNNSIVLPQLSIPLLEVIDSDKSLGNELKSLGFSDHILEELNNNLERVTNDEHKTYFNKVFHKKYRELSIKCHPDKFPEGSIEREMATQRQQRLNSVSEAMGNLHNLCLNRNLRTGCCEGSPTVNIYTLDYNSCFHLSVDMVRHEQLEIMNGAIISQLSILSGMRNDNLVRYYNEFIINAQEFLQNCRRKFNVIFRDGEGIEIDIEKFRNSQTKYIEDYNRCWVRELEQVTEIFENRKSIFQPILIKVKELLAESKAQAEILSFCSHLVSPLCNPKATHNPAPNSTILIDENNSSPSMYFFQPLCNAGIRKRQVGLSLQMGNNSVTPLRAGHFKNADRVFILPVVEYSNIIYLYFTLYRKSLPVNKFVTFENIKIVRKYINNCPLEKLHDFCNELVIYYCSYRSDKQRLLDFLKEENISIEPLKDKNVAVLLVAGLMKYGDVLMQDFKEKLSMHTLITRKFDQYYKTQERLEKLSAVGVNINTYEILNKNNYITYIRNIIENDLKLRLTRENKSEQRPDEDLKLILTYVMKGVTEYVNEHELAINDKTIIYMVDEIVDKLRSQNQKPSLLLLAELAKNCLDAGKPNPKPNISMATNVKHVTDYNMTLKKALNLLKLDDSKLTMFNEHSKLVINDTNRKKNVYELLHEFIRQPSDTDSCFYRSVYQAMENIYVNCAKKDFECYANISVCLLIKEEVFYALSCLHAEESYLIECRNIFFQSSREIIKKLYFKNELRDVEEDFFNIQKTYISNYITYCKELETLTVKCKNKSNLKCILPEMKILLKESKHQCEILQYESFNYFRGLFADVLDFLQMRPNSENINIDQDFVLPIINLCNVITKLKDDLQRRTFEQEQEMTDFEEYNLLKCINNCSLNDLRILCNYSANYYCNGDDCSKEILLEFLSKININCNENLNDKIVASISVRGLLKYICLLKEEKKPTLDITAEKIRNIGERNREADRSRDKNLRDVIETIILERLPTDDTVAHGIFLKLSDMIIGSVMCGIHGCHNLTVEVLHDIADAVINQLKNSWREPYRNINPQDSDGMAKIFKKKIEERVKNFLKKEGLDFPSLFDISYHEQENESSVMKLNPHQNYHVGQTISGGDCFYRSVLQGLRQLMPDEDWNTKMLRKMCFEYANSYENNQWFKEAIIKDANQEVADEDIWSAYVKRIKYSKNKMEELKDEGSSMYNLLTSDKYGSTLVAPIWGRPEIEGRAICNVLNKRYERDIEIHVLERHDLEEGEEKKEVWTSQIIDSNGSRSSSDIDYEKSNVIHIINSGNGDFVPLLRKPICKPKNVNTADNRGKEAEEKLEAGYVII